MRVCLCAPPQVCKLPTILAHPWFERLVGDSPSRLVSKSAFLEWWLNRRLVTASPSKRLWELLRPEGRHHLTYADFRPLLQAVLQYHPGLEFLADTPEFQARYAETVIYRIFYTINRCVSSMIGHHGCGSRAGQQHDGAACMCCCVSVSTMQVVCRVRGKQQGHRRCSPLVDRWLMP